jgi:hypothetical protein
MNNNTASCSEVLEYRKIPRYADEMDPLINVVGEKATRRYQHYALPSPDGRHLAMLSWTQQYQHVDDGKLLKAAPSVSI